MKGEVFIDSGAFIAFLVATDRSHAEVRALFTQPPRRLSTSAFVVAETYGWTLHRAGEEAARTYRRFLASLPALEILDGNAAHRAAVWQKLEILRGTNLTFVDASSLVWIEQRKISIVWGTDHHLSIEGAQVIPGSA